LLNLLPEGRAKGSPIWITEIGWPVESSYWPPDKYQETEPLHLAVSEAIQRDLLNATLTVMKERSSDTGEGAYDIAKVFYYDSEDIASERDWAYPFGLRADRGSAENGRYREAWYAFQAQAPTGEKYP